MFPRFSAVSTASRMEFFLVAKQSTINSPLDGRISTGTTVKEGKELVNSSNVETRLRSEEN